VTNKRKQTGAQKAYKIGIAILAIIIVLSMVLSMIRF
jgi:hypothetical protein